MNSDLSINWNEIMQSMQDNLGKMLVNVAVIILVFIAARILHNGVSRLTGKIIENAKNTPEEKSSKELITSMTLFRSVSRYVLYFIAICISINQLGFGSLAFNMVAAAGIGAIVISMGAQSIIGDMFAGLFIMFERQYTVGDFVKINEYVGTVRSLAMRCTYLVTVTGERVIIPNGQVRTVVNYTAKNSSAVVIVPTPYEEDTERMIALIREAAENYQQEHPRLCTAKPVINGIHAFGPSSVDIMVMQPTKGGDYITVERDLRLAIKKRLDREGISIPFTQLVIHNPE